MVARFMVFLWVILVFGNEVMILVGGGQFEKIGGVSYPLVFSGQYMMFEPGVPEFVPECA